MKMPDLTASTFRFLLIAAMLLIAILAVAGFYFAQQQLRVYATDISELNAAAAAGGKSLATLRKLSVKLDELESSIAKTKSIVAESKEYRYQDQIINDLTEIGRSTGVTVTGFNFSSAAAAGTPAPTGTSTPEVTQPSDTGSTLKSQNVTVTIDSPLEYANLMNFIKKIELNPLKMQIASVSIAKGEKGSQVTSESFTIEVYVR